jgi:energy-dependent translational throttle protein EttA
MSAEKIIFSMAGVSKIYPPQKKVLKDIYLSFFYGAKIGVLGLNGSGKFLAPHHRRHGQGFYRAK